MNTIQKNSSTHDLSRIMGILNVTPDSFSDGSVDLGFNLEKMSRLFSDGADLVDIGAEATGPASTPIDIKTEWSRLEPLLKKIPDKYRDCISVDTRKEEIAVRVLDYGIRFINCQGGMLSERFFSSVTDIKSFKYVCMHPGTPLLRSSHLIEDTRSFFKSCQDKLIGFGLDPSNIYMDYGIGFCKTDPENLALLFYTHRLSNEFNLLVGMSRKSFIGRLLGIKEPTSRDPFTKGVEFGLLGLSKIIRTHNVASLYKLKSTLCESKAIK